MTVITKMLGKMKRKKHIDTSQFNNGEVWLKQVWSLGLFWLGQDRHLPYIAFAICFRILSQVYRRERLLKTVPSLVCDEKNEGLCAPMGAILSQPAQLLLSHRHLAHYRHHHLHHHHHRHHHHHHHLNTIITVMCSRLTNNQMLWSFQHLVSRKPRLSWFHSWGWR